MPENKERFELTCTRCGGKLLRSRDWVVTGYPYWMRPWGSALKMSEVIIPYACLDCGRVEYILRDIHKIRRDLDKMSEDEKRRLYASK